jgi:hypothetical protein
VEPSEIHMYKDGLLNSLDLMLQLNLIVGMVFKRLLNPIDSKGKPEAHPSVLQSHVLQSHIETPSFS